jgi:hypothetical protein
VTKREGITLIQLLLVFVIAGVERTQAAVKTGMLE